MCANVGLFHFSFSIRYLVPLLFAPPAPLIPIHNQPSRVENVFITCFHHSWVCLKLYTMKSWMAKNYLYSPIYHLIPRQGCLLYRRLEFTSLSCSSFFQLGPNFVLHTITELTGVLMKCILNCGVFHAITWCAFLKVAYSITLLTSDMMALALRSSVVLTSFCYMGRLCTIDIHHAYS